jgi:hypothetical protein
MSNIWARFFWHVFRFFGDASVTRAAGSCGRGETAVQGNNHLWSPAFLEPARAVMFKVNQVGYSKIVGLMGTGMTITAKVGRLDLVHVEGERLLRVDVQLADDPRAVAS